MTLLAPVSCGDSRAGRAQSAAAAHWRRSLHVAQIVDVAGPRADGRLVVAAGGRLSLLRPGGRPQPFARGPGGYRTARGPEPYIAHSTGQRVAGAGCRFEPDAVFALEPKNGPGVIAVAPGGRARRFARLAGAGLPNGIAFDTTGRFGRRLLVTATGSRRTSVFALDCRGRVRTLTRTAPPVEGGIAVAPTGFGRFAGQLIAPDEVSGRILAVAPSGRTTLVAKSGLPGGGDIGVESAGFVPRGFGAGWTAYLADRSSPGNPHPGDDALLALGGSSLLGAGVRTGDLLVASEAGARSVAVRCGRGCRVRRVADGPAVAHAEGHIAFARSR